MATLNDLLGFFNVKPKKSSAPTADELASGIAEAKRRQQAAEGIVAGVAKRRRNAILARDHEAADAAERDGAVAARESDAISIELGELEAAYVEAVRRETEAARAKLIEKHRAANRATFDALANALDAAIEAQAAVAEAHRAAQSDLGFQVWHLGIHDANFSTTLSSSAVSHWRQSLERAFTLPAPGPVVIGRRAAEPEQESETKQPPPEPDEKGNVAIRVRRPIDQGLNLGALMPGDTTSKPADEAARLVETGHAEYMRDAA